MYEISDVTKAALESKLLPHANRQREVHVRETLAKLAELTSKSGWDLLRHEDLSWRRYSDFDKQHGCVDTPGIELFAKVGQHLFSRDADSIDAVSLRPTSDAGSGWVVSIGCRRGYSGGGGVECDFTPEQILEAIEAVEAADRKGVVLEPVPGALSGIPPAPSTFYRIIVFAPDARGKVHRFSHVMDHRLTGTDVLAATFDLAIRTGVLTGSLDDYGLRDPRGRPVSLEAPLWGLVSDHQQHPLVLELVKCEAQDGRVQVRINFRGGPVVTNLYRRDDSLFKVVREALVAGGYQPSTAGVVRTMADALVDGAPLDVREVVGVLAGETKEVALVFDFATVDELEVDVVGFIDPFGEAISVRAHATESNRVSDIIASALNKLNDYIRKTGVRLPFALLSEWSLEVNGVVLDAAMKWSAVRRTHFPEANAVSNVSEGAGEHGLVAAANRPFALSLRSKL